MASHRVMVSGTTERLILEGQIDWKVKNFEAMLKACKNLTSPDFKFFFPQVDKTYKFGLKIEPFMNHTAIFLVNRNPETVKISAEMLFRSKSNSFDGDFEAESSRMLWELWLTPAQIRKITDAASALNVRVRFSLFEDPKAAANGLSEVLDTDQRFHQTLKDLLTDTRFSDFTIKSGNEKFSCHKAVLANRSDVFARFFSSGGWIESEKNTFRLDSHEPAIVKQMLEFIYTDKLPDGTACSLELMILADQFNLKDLIHLCEEELSKLVSRSNAIRILNIADKVAEAKRLKSYVVKVVAKNIFAFIGTEDWKAVVDPNPELLATIKKSSKVRKGQLDKA